MKVHPILLGLALVGCTGQADGPSDGGADDSTAAGQDADKDG